MKRNFTCKATSPRFTTRVWHVAWQDEDGNVCLVSVTLSRFDTEFGSALYKAGVPEGVPFIVEPEL